MGNTSCLRSTTTLQAGRPSLQRRRLESDATRCCGRDRCHDYAAGGLFFDVATMVLHQFPSLGLKSRIDARRRGFPRVLPELAESLHRKKRAPHLCERLSAVRTRLELATPGVTGRYSNRLNYRTSLDSLERECKDSDFFRFSNSEDIFFKKYLLCLRLEFNIYEPTKIL